MKQDIRFKGLMLNRDEQSAEHGELCVCGGVELHDGALRPSVLVGTDIAGGATLTNRLLYVHETANYTHYITVNQAGTTLYYSIPNAQGTAWSTTEISHAFSNIRSITSVGNTLCVMDDNGLHYILCKSTSNSWTYNYLGQQPPFTDIQFSLQFQESAQTADNQELYTASAPGDYEWEIGEETIPEEARGSLTDQVMAEINKRVDKVLGEGYFYAPFLIRYCYRLFDGSMVMHSSPCLMSPILQHPVIVKGKIYHVDNKELEYYVFTLQCKLKWRIFNDLTNLKAWGDIVKSIDVFITPQYSRIDTSGLIKIKGDPNLLDGLVSIVNGQKFDILDYIDGTYNGLGDEGSDVFNVPFPEVPESEYLERLRNASSFFLLKSVKLEELPDSYFLDYIDFDSSVVKNITVQEQMTDDYKTHNLLKPMSENSGLYVYNHRLNVYSLSETLFEGFSPNVMFQWSGVATTSPESYIEITAVTVYISTDKGVVERTISGSWRVDLFMIKEGYCFYPDSRAVAIKFTYRWNGSLTTFVRALESCRELNGAASFYGSETTAPTATSGITVPMPNKVYTSRADNPFYFPNLPGESGINSVGVGEILGLSVATRALSQGQVGDHDLIAFCTDGIWVFKVTQTGTYSQLHNISREVCVNKKSICQLDQSVIFASGNALNRFVESNVLPVSDVLDGPFFSTTRLPGFNANFTNNAAVAALLGFATAPVNYFKTGQVLFDSVSSRFIVLPQDMSSAFVALVFSIRDQAWSTMYVDALKAAINGYPYPYLQYGSGKIVRLDKPYDFNPTSVAPATVPVYDGIIVTRTLTFSDTMDIVRGFRQYTDCATMPLLFFYGSNDQRTWQYIGKSSRSFHNYMPGHPYRFFRVAIFIDNMRTDEKYQSLALEIVNKYAKL